MDEIKRMQHGLRMLEALRELLQSGDLSAEECDRAERIIEFDESLRAPGAGDEKILGVSMNLLSNAHFDLIEAFLAEHGVTVPAE